MLSVYLRPTCSLSARLSSPWSLQRGEAPLTISPASLVTLLVYFFWAALLHGCISGYGEEVIAESV